MKTTKKLTALMAAFIFAFAFAVVKPQRVQAEGYKITFDPAGSGKVAIGGTTITSAKKDAWVYVEPIAVAGKYVTSWTATPECEGLNDSVYTTFKMPAADVTLTPNYASQTALNVDLSGDETATIDNDGFFGLMQLYYPLADLIDYGYEFKFDLDNDGNEDVKMTYNATITIEKLSSTNLTGTYSVTKPNTSKYSPFNFKFGESGNTGGGNNPANESGATTGETPADPKNADPNKAPKTGESNAFVLSMLGIIAVAGMGLYVGKRQEN